MHSLIIHNCMQTVKLNDFFDLPSGPLRNCLNVAFALSWRLLLLLTIANDASSFFLGAIADQYRCFDVKLWPVHVSINPNYKSTFTSWLSLLILTVCLMTRQLCCPRSSHAQKVNIIINNNKL